MSSRGSSSPHLALGSGDASKRSASDAKLDSDSPQAAKRKRPQSCDTCRSRKIKCVRLQVDGLDPMGDNRCVQCRAIDAKCTFDYVPKRPGPQSSFAKTARREAEAQAQAQNRVSAQSNPRAQLQHAAAGLSHSRTSTSGFSNTPAARAGGPSQHAPQSAASGSPADDSWYRALAQQNFASGGGSGTQTRASSWSGGTNFDTYLNNSMLAMTPNQFPGMPGASPFDFSPHNIANLSGPSPSMSVSNASSATPGSYAGSTSWQAPPRSEAGSSRSAAPRASLSQIHQQQQSNHSHVDQMSHSLDMASGLVGGDARSTALPPLPIPSFSRVTSPAPASAPLPQDSEQDRSHTQQSRSEQPSQPHQQAPPFDSSMHPMSTIAPGSSSSRQGPNALILSKMESGPILNPRSLEDVAPRQTFLSIVSLYFHYLWPLLPIVDRPTFSHDLLNRRDERDEAFLAFVLSLTSYTLIQCPRTVIPAPWTVYRKLHRICHLTSRQMQPRVYDPPQLLHVNTLYCDHIYLGTIGKTNAANAVLAEAVRVAYSLGLHDQRKFDTSRNVAPYGLDASSFAHYRAPTGNTVDRELRNRMFWVLHGSSTTIAMLGDEPALIHAIDACVDLPLAVDEEALTNPGYIQRSPSVLSGFLTVTRLHQVMLELLESYRRDRRFPIDDLNVARSRIRYLADMLRRIQQTIDDMPEELKNPVYTHAPPEPIRRPGGAVPALESVSRQQQDAPLLQAIGFDAATQTALGDHLSGTSPWPWPAETFTRQGLPSNPSNSNSSPPLTTTTSGGEGLTSVDIVNIFRPTPPPPSSSNLVLSPMCTLHANIVTTESLLRFLVTEYRELVLSRLSHLKLHHPSFSSPEDLGGPGWEEAASNMLRVFNSLPLDALASNGQSLISKIVYVVSALLGKAKGAGVEGRGWVFMESLLGTLSRLSRTRMEQQQSEDEEERLYQNSDRSSGEGRGGGSGSGNAGGTEGPSRGRDRDHADRGDRRDSSNGPHQSSHSRSSGVHFSQNQPNDSHTHHRQQQDSFSSAFDPLTPSTTTITSNTNSAVSSAVNTASTTPTSEHPNSMFYDKILSSRPTTTTTEGQLMQLSYPQKQPPPSPFQRPAGVAARG